MRRWLLYLLTVLVTLLFFFPIYWAISLSIRPPSKVFDMSWLGIPWIAFEPQLGAWRRQLSDLSNQAALWRSAWVATLATLIALALGLPASWSLARMRRRGLAATVVLGALALRMMPTIALLVPFYMMFYALDLLDTGIALVLVNATFLLPLAIIIMRQAFVELPPELEEAASLDGAGPVTVFTRVVLPLVAPSIAGTGLVLFAWAWNDYFYALSMFVLEAHTITLRVQRLGSPSPDNAAMMLIAIGLPMLVTLVAQRWLIRGLTLGAVKG